jgi:hypothetical protein
MLLLSGLTQNIIIQGAFLICNNIQRFNQFVVKPIEKIIKIFIKQENNNKVKIFYS